MKITVGQLKQLIREQVEAQQDAQAIQSATDDIRNPKQATIQQAVAAFKELQQNDPELAAKIKAEAQKMAQKNPQIKQAIAGGSGAGGSGIGEYARPTQGLATALTLMGPLGGAVLGAAAASGALTIPVALLGLGALALGGLGVYGGKDTAIRQKEYDEYIEDVGRDIANTISTQSNGFVMSNEQRDQIDEFVKELEADETLDQNQKEKRKQEFINREVKKLKSEEAAFQASRRPAPGGLSEMVRREVKRQLRNKR